MLQLKNVKSVRPHRLGGFMLLLGSDKVWLSRAEPGSPMTGNWSTRPPEALLLLLCLSLQTQHWPPRGPSASIKPHEGLPHLSSQAVNEDGPRGEVAFSACDLLQGVCLIDGPVVNLILPSLLRAALKGHLQGAENTSGAES